MLEPQLAAPIVRQLVTTDGDELIAGAAGVSGQVVRTGRGRDSAALTAVNFGTAHLTVTDFGFPIAGEGVNPSDCVSLFTVLDGPAWTNADGFTLAPGSTVLYPPGALRHARDPAGVRCAGTVVPLGQFEAAARDLGLDPDLDGAPRVIDGGTIWSRLAPLAKLDVRGGSVGSFAVQVDPDGLIESAVHAASHRAVSLGPARRRLDDADIVRTAAAYLDATDSSMVPVIRLCRHVGVSERRLQIAFRNRLGVGPNRFMRLRALQASHRALLVANASTSTVSEVARNAGFWHLGRFTSYYRSIYGEVPSATLRRASRS